ncbi:MAG: mechanosensitive ion channel family protein [Candidatus Bathyarchaeia archaeon]|jgi:small-conductance mechanosensitive channel
MSLNVTATPAPSLNVTATPVPTVLPSNSTGFLSDVIQHTLNISPSNAEILVSLIILGIVGLVGWTSYFVISRYVTSWTKKTETTLDDNIVASVKIIIIIMIIILGIEYSLSPLSFLQPHMNTLRSVFLITQILLSAYAISRITSVVTDWFAGKTTALSKGKNNNHIVFILKKVITIVIFIVAIVIIINSLNLQGALETTLVGFGVGGIAVAFALQSTLSDVFSAFSLYFDHPFEIGDFIVVGDYSGTVKSIGMRATRIQLLQGEELVISNKELTSTSIRNFRKLETRRVTFNIGVTYETSSEKLKKIPQLIIDVIRNVRGATPQYVNFTEYGEFSLKFFISYFVKSSDYGMYLEIQQEINLGIKEAFEKEGIEMAYPTNVTYLKK